MRVEQLMTRDVKTCDPRDTLTAAAKIMWDHDCGCVPVVEGEQMVGMITDRDICMAAYTQGRPLDAIEVRSAMAKEVRSCRPGDTLTAAERILVKNRIRRLPVVDAAGRLVGILSLNDVVREVAREHTPPTKETSAESFAETMAAICEPRAPRGLPAAA